MSLLDEVEDLIRRPSGPPCKIENIFSVLPKSEHADLQALLDNEIRYPATKVALVLKKRTGVDISDFSVRRHRRGMCACRPS